MEVDSSLRGASAKEGCRHGQASTRRDPGYCRECLRISGPAVGRIFFRGAPAVDLARRADIFGVLSTRQSDRCRAGKTASNDAFRVPNRTALQHRPQHSGPSSSARSEGFPGRRPFRDHRCRLHHGGTALRLRRPTAASSSVIEQLGPVSTVYTLNDLEGGQTAEIFSPASNMDDIVGCPVI